MAWVKGAAASRGSQGDVDLEKGESGRCSAASGRGSDAGSAPEPAPAPTSKEAAAKAKRDRYKSMTTTALEAARQQAQAERDAAAQGFEAAERAEREYLARKRAKAAHRDWAETREQWREGAALLRAAFHGFWRAVGNVRHLLAWRAQERRQSAQIADAQRADVEKRKIEEKLRRELAEDDDDDVPADADAPDVPEVPEVHRAAPSAHSRAPSAHSRAPSTRSLTPAGPRAALPKTPSCLSLAHAAPAPEDRPSDVESAVLPGEKEN